MYKKKRGIGLLELILVLVVMAVIIVLAAKRYKVYQFQSNLYTLQKSVGQVVSQYNSYYLENCTSNWSKNKTVPFSALDLEADTVPNPFCHGDSCTYKLGTIDTNISGTKRYSRKLYVEIPFDSKYSDNLDYFKGRLNASDIYSADGTKGLKWEFPPAKQGITNDPTSPEWITAMGMRRFMGTYEQDNPCWFPTY